MKIGIPKGASKIIGILQQNGYKAYVVGGCVRDAYIGKQPQDWDITTNALPETVKELFSNERVVETGIAHGTVTVLTGGEQYEITTFRADGEYTDHRHPDSVTFTKHIADDLSRRDFTINAMAYNDTEGLIDLYGGKDDIDKGILRTVGNGEDRFEEDALRILRGLRFASILGYSIHEDTQKAMKKCKNLLCYVAGERRYDEISKLIMGDHAKDVLLAYPDVIACAMPEISMSIGFDQKNKHHIYNVWDHTVYALSNTPADKVSRLTVLLHDLGKPHTFSEDQEGTGHFYGHAAKSAEIATEFFSRSSEKNDIRQRVCRLVSLHDSDLFASEGSIKRWLSKLGEQDLLRLVDIKKADNLAQSPKYRGRAEELEKLRIKIKEIASQKPCISVSMLPVNGHDMVALGFKGAQIGKVLDELLEAVMDSRCENSRRPLLSMAEQIKHRD